MISNDKIPCPDIKQWKSESKHKPCCSGVLTFYHCIAQTVGLDEEFSSCESYKIQGGEEVDVP